MPYRYAVNLLLALDQLANAILLGDPDETVSSRLGKLLRDRRANVFARLLCRLIDLVDPGHCRDAIEIDEGKDGLVN